MMDSVLLVNYWQYITCQQWAVCYLSMMGCTIMDNVIFL